MAQSSQQDQDRAVHAIAAIERRIIEEAGRHAIHGLRLEWNEDLDFGHLMDPVPVVAIASDGRQAEERFPLQEMAQYDAQGHAACEKKVEHIVRALVQAVPSDDVSGSRGD